ncbi:DNA polymerase III subunit [Butyrivibrio sp. MC2013]|uniref:DNA polymerase III subunit n=1 Tax=Butyrivibrio sp. MC2013 TaxID=1280686 RepID=UPI000400F34A|nr:DNA polymerase III subunit delta' C-terminal domain-containing protein [Butyrivibrio sp. MC2013]
MGEFKDILGQEQIKDHLFNALTTGKVSHAYIISGEKESGKMLIAETFAQALLCTDRKASEVEPCGSCHSCIQAVNHDNPDIITVTHEKPATISVDEIRAMCDDVYLKPYQGDHKIYIIPEGEKMNIQAQNALLKTLEEPPAYCVIIILTDNPDAFLPTILSRCIMLPIKPVPDSMIRSFLMEHYHVPDYRADVCAGFARGNVGKAIMLSGNEHFDEMRKRTMTMVSKLSQKTLTENLSEMKEILKNYDEALKAAEEERLAKESAREEADNPKKGRKKAKSSDDQPKEDKNAKKTASKDSAYAFLDILLFLIRDIMVKKAAEDEQNLILSDELSYIRDAASKCSFHALRLAGEEVERARRRIRSNVNTDLALEVMMIDLKDYLAG